jgi:hypothetical protein
MRLPKVRNFLYFLKALWRQAVYLLTSSGIAAAAIYEHWRGESIPAKASLLIAAILLVRALYKTWLGEHQELEAAKANHPVEVAQARLYDAEREEIERRRKREERMKELTAPGSGIRQLVAKEIEIRKATMVYTTERLAEVSGASQAEIEEAIRILESQGFARQTKIHVRWLIFPWRNPLLYRIMLTHRFEDGPESRRLREVTLVGQMQDLSLQ